MKKLLLLTLLLTGCTDNTSVKLYGGKATLDLPKGEKLINITWKENSIWYLTRPRTLNEEPTTYTFQEKSPVGIVQGSYTINEK